MVPKWFIYFFILLGSALGSCVPLLWGASLFSFSSVILSGIGCFVGIWVAIKIANSI